MPVSNNQVDIVIQPGRSSPRRLLTVGVIIFLLIHLFLILRRAWLCDDAYITFRTVDNLVNGYKLTWNTIERVQAYTHPLWLLLISPFYYFYRNIYSIGIALSILISMAAIILAAFKLARTRVSALLLVLLLSLSNAYLDYSTSGLENHLTHLLLVIFCIIYFTDQPSTRRMFLLSLMASLGGLNRLDTLLLYIPALAFAFWECRGKKAFLVALAGQTPLILWELFSLFYYGFLFPNTAYAKLNTGIPAGDLLLQGFYYLENSIMHDPLTLVTIVAGFTAAFISRERRSYPLLAGMLLYILYLLKIGGDFMSGRFFTAPFLLAVIIISRVRFNRFELPSYALMAATALVLALLAPYRFYQMSPVKNMNITDEHGITIERLWYFGDFGLFSPSRVDLALSAGKSGVEARQKSAGDLYVMAVQNIGVFGYYAGPTVFVIDQFALADPLLARLPAERKLDWRVGHYERVIPDGYRNTIYRRGRMDDIALAQFYDRLEIIKGSHLFSLKRFLVIWKMNIGFYDQWIHKDAYRYPEMVFTTLGQLNALADSGGSGEDRLAFKDSGIQIDLGESYHASRMGICLESDDDYSIEYRSDNITLVSQKKLATSDQGDMMCYLLEVPRKASNQEFNSLRIFPLRGNGEYGVGHIRLVR